MPTTPYKVRRVTKRVDDIVLDTHVHVDNELPLGAINGTNDLFLTAESFRAGSTKVFLNGLRQKIGISHDYIEIAPNKIQFAAAPRTGNNLTIDYIKS